jgi:GTP pyrophosphokinase
MKTSDTVTTVSDAAPKLTEPTPHLITATSEVLPDQVNALARACLCRAADCGEVMETGKTP